MTEHPLPGLLLAVGAAGGWWLLYGCLILASRPARPRAATPTQDLGRAPHPPAVVSLLVNRWRITEDAAEATLLDLAARRIVEFRQPGHDPTLTTVHVRVATPAGLNAYEQRVFDRVAGLAVDGVVPLTALTFRDQTRADRFAKHLRAEVVADARRRGLSRRRLSPVMFGVLAAGALLAGVGVGAGLAMALDPSDGSQAKTFWWVWVITTTMLVGISTRDLGERDTPAGRAAAAHWLGVRAWLRNTEAFGDLPPGAVAVWDRYLAYGAATGATPVSSAVIDLGMGDRRRVWSSFGGTWRRVRVSYPRFWPRYGKTASPFLLPRLFWIGLGLLLLNGVPFLPFPAVTADPVRRTALTLALAAVATYFVVRTIIDVLTPLTITGQVLWIQVWRSTSTGKNSPPRPVLHHLAVDDGRQDRTRAWALPSELAGSCTSGDTVTFTAYRWTRRVVDLSVIERGALPQADGSDDTTGDPEALIASAMGTPEPPAPRERATPPVLPLSAGEVGRALGFAVVPQPTLPLPGGRIDAFHDQRGRLVLTATVMSGASGRMAIRTRRRSSAVPGIGDEAYAGNRWAISRRGENVIVLRVRGPARSAGPATLCRLLDTAVRPSTRP